MPTKSPGILLVGNNPVRSFVDAVTLGDAGYQVDCLPDGVDVVEYSGTWHPGAVVVDVDEPEGAADLCARLRAHPTTRSLPIVVIAPDAPGATQSWMARGLADWIVERYGTAALEDALAHALGRASPSPTPSDRATSPDALLPLAADALAANAHLLAVHAFRKAVSPKSGSMTEPGIGRLTRLLVAIARAARLGIPAARLNAIPAIRALIGAYAADIRQRGPLPSMAVRGIQALRDEVDRLLRRLARRGAFSENAVSTVVGALDQYLDALVQLVADDYWRQLTAYAIIDGDNPGGIA